MFKRNSFFSKLFLAVLIVTLVAANGIVGFKDGTNLFKPAIAEAATVEKAPKYVFYFIGDGLGAAQRQIAEYFLQEKTGDKSAKLLINQLPVAGINTTYSASSLVTDSAAAGTALATGHKTNNGIISKLPDGTDIKTLVEAAEEKGMATGIATTTRLTHATPAVFASHNESRSNENEIAVDFLDSNVEFFAGGGARHFLPQGWVDDMPSMNGSKRKDNRNLLKEFADKGYKIFYGKEQSDKFRNYKPKGQEKVLATFTLSHLPYEIDRIHDTNNQVPSLAEITKKGIEVLSKYPNGFFFMIEGGRIDHACHTNDAVGAIHDILAFDAAVKEAYKFYKEHPDETLIVVVGDHETGGMGLGFSKNYYLKLNELLDVKASVGDVLAKKYNGDRDAYFKYIAENFGLDNLTEKEKAEIIKAMDLVDKKAEYDVAKYGPSYYNPVAVATTHVISKRANIEWTTFAHSGTSIPMSAVGVGSEKFTGFKDNTEIARTLASIMGVELSK
ncbi:alkaline phosphatase [Caminicella sporogenes DSM 14501]|uniref:Alkaline phosphatase n=1 Tax=Caminicella sporogenes DSM 14501 TaxID=1121266 RepID=A0A1M6N100_9FIRM|nr:alkaline phosphatase [Caminicella sporogenes]RKD22411.1 alkaline phosphatase [Caminicella sporogenes]SHJ89365.1 alkaline phosphatase [Caminicella sporogenes DSM 14501]